MIDIHIYRIRVIIASDLGNGILHIPSNDMKKALFFILLSFILPHGAYAYTIASQTQAGFSQSLEYKNATLSPYPSLVEQLLGNGLSGTAESISVYVGSTQGDTGNELDLFSCNSDPFNSASPTTTFNNVAGCSVVTYFLNITPPSTANVYTATTSVVFDPSKYYVIKYYPGINTNKITNIYGTENIVGNNECISYNVYNGAVNYCSLTAIYYSIDTTSKPGSPALNAFNNLTGSYYVATSTQSTGFNCSSIDIGCYLKEAFAWAFYPDQSTMSYFQSISLASTTPFSYFYSAKEIFNTSTSTTNYPTWTFHYGNSTTTLNLYTSLTNLVGTSGLTTLRTFIGYIAWGILILFVMGVTDVI